VLKTQPEKESLNWKVTPQCRSNSKRSLEARILLGTKKKKASLFEGLAHKRVLVREKSEGDRKGGGLSKTSRYDPGEAPLKNWGEEEGELGHVTPAKKKNMRLGGGGLPLCEEPTPLT